MELPDFDWEMPSAHKCKRRSPKEQDREMSLSQKYHDKNTRESHKLDLLYKNA